MDADKQAAIQRVVDDPAGAVKRALNKEGRTFLDISALVLALQDVKLWPELRDAGVVGLLIEIFVDGFNEEPDKGNYWVLPLTGIINMLVSLKKDEGSRNKEENTRVLAIVKESYPRLEAILFQDLGSITSQEAIGVLSLGLYHFSRVPGFTTELYSRETLGLLAICWLRASKLTSRRVTCVVLRTLLVGPQTPKYALENILHTLGGPEKIIGQLRKLLDEDMSTLDTTQIGVELVAADAFVDIRHPSAPKYSELNFDAYLANFLSKVLGQSDLEEDKKWLVANSTAPILNNIINAAKDPAEALTKLISTSDFFDVATKSLLIAAPREDSYDSAWYRIFKMMIHTARCSDQTCRVHATPDYTSSLRNQFQPNYIGTLDRMDTIIAKTAFIPGLEGGSNADRSQAAAALWQSVLSWRALGIALDLNEEVERNSRTRAEEQPFCWYAQCDKTPAGETYKRCSGCKAVTYCSAEHQGKDWKDSHKSVCSILQNA